MSRFSGPQHKGAVRDLKRERANKAPAAGLDAPTSPRWTHAIDGHLNHDLIHGATVFTGDQPLPALIAYSDDGFSRDYSPACEARINREITPDIRCGRAHYGRVLGQSGDTHYICRDHAADLTSIGVAVWVH